MHEIGGYFEMETFHGKEYHMGAYAFDSGRNALAALVKARQYKNVYIPDFSCDSMADGIKKGGATVTYYSVDENFRPMFSSILNPEEALLIVNYYGQINNEELASYVQKYARVIIDNTQAFFRLPLPHVDTTYSCRKFFGVADGGYLYTDTSIEKYTLDVSVERMLFVLGRYDEDASTYYQEASHNNEIFSDKPIQMMSKLTHNLLRAIDYDAVALQRKHNADYLHSSLNRINKVNVQVPYGAFMYPLMVNSSIGGGQLRKILQQSKIYVPCLWPDTLSRTSKDTVAYQLAENIVPLPCDQRYDIEDMDYILKKIYETVK